MRIKRFQRTMVLGLTALNSVVYGISFRYTYQQTFILTLFTTSTIAGFILIYAAFQKSLSKRKARIK